MPFAIWCSTCQPTDTVLIGQGVRFNAEKKKVGNYYSTPIYSFRMKHGPCGGWIEIRTDPKNTEYVVTEGARRKITSEFGKGEYEEDGVGEIRIKLPGQEEGDDDPLARLEGKVADKEKFMTAQARMEELLKKQAKDWEDPYEKSRKLRRVFRAERKGREAAQQQTEAIKDKMSLGIELLEETEGDRVRAGLIDFGSSASGAEDTLSLNARTRPLFSSTGQTTTSEMSSTTRKQRKLGKRISARKAAAEIVANRKALLQHELRGNTRAAIDPFLNDVDEPWQTGSRKRRTDAIGTKTSGKDPDYEQVGQDEPVTVTEIIRDAKSTTIEEPQASDGQLPGNSMLVDYDSDTE